MADETNTTEGTVTDENGVPLAPIPYMSQDYDDMMTSLSAAIEARKALMQPLIDLMDGPEVKAVIDWLEAHYQDYRNEPLVWLHIDGALGCMKRLRDASKS